MSTSTANQLIYNIALTLIPGIGHVNARKLIAYTGTAEALFNEKKSNLKKIDRIGDFVVKCLSNFGEYLERAEEEIAFAEKYGIKISFFTDIDFPVRLNQCADGPILIYTKGNANLNEKHIVSIVGTRKATDYGREVCRSLIEGLSIQNVTIVSGLAYGIDTYAHRFALEHSLPTIGVLAHGLDRIYPYVNKKLSEEMLENGGLVTEFMSNNEPDRENFPMRNRIIAGLADATIVVEAGLKGGALITADIANSYNRDVFAVPGRVSDSYSEGCNNLIKTNRAALIQRAEDVFYIMGWDKPSDNKPVQQKLFIHLEPEEEIVLEMLQNKGDCSIDKLCIDTGLSAGKIATALLNLEFEGLIRSLPGKMYKATK